MASSFLRVSYAAEEDIVDIEDFTTENWCFCKQPQNSKLMLCCDFCDTWYHSDCVGISKVKITKMAEDREKYKCLFCKDKENQAKEQERLQKLREYMGDEGEPKDDPADEKSPMSVDESAGEVKVIKSALVPILDVDMPVKTEASKISALTPDFEEVSSALTPVTIDKSINQVPVKSALMPVFDEIKPEVSTGESSELEANVKEEAKPQENDGSSNIDSKVELNLIEGYSELAFDLASTTCSNEQSIEIQKEVESDVKAAAEKPAVVKVEADSSIEDVNEKVVSEVNQAALSNGSTKPSPVQKQEEDSSDDEALVAIKPKPMLLPPISKGKLRKKSESSSSSDSSSSSSSSSSDSSDSSSSDSDNSHVKSGSKRKVLNKKQTQSKNQQKAKLNTMYKNSAKLNMFAAVVLPRLPEDIVDKCKKGAKLSWGELNELRKTSKDFQSTQEAKSAPKKPVASSLSESVQNVAADSGESSGEDKKVKKDKFKLNSKFPPAPSSILPWHRSKEIQQTLSANEQKTAKTEESLKESSKNEEAISMEALAGLEVSTIPLNRTQDRQSESEPKTDASAPPKAGRRSSSEDEIVDDQPKPSKIKKKKAKEKSPPPEKKEKKKKIRAPSSSDDESTRTEERVGSKTSHNGVAASIGHEPVDDDAKLRLLDEDLFKKPKKKKKKEEKPALSPNKPTTVATIADDSTGLADEDEDLRSQKAKPKSVKSKEQHGSGRKCIVPMCGRTVTVGGGESNFCQRQCIKRHVKKFWDAVGYKPEVPGSEGGIQSSEVSSSQDKVIVRLVDRRAHITVDGSRAPNIADIYKWLRRNPTYEIIMPERKQSEIMEDIRNKNRKLLLRKLIEVNSSQSKLGKPTPPGALQKIATDFENNLWHFNEKEITSQYKDCMTRVIQYLDANRDLLDWLVNGRLTSQHLVLMTEDDFRKVGTSKFIDFVPQSDLFPQQAVKSGGVRSRPNDILSSLMGDTTSGHGKTHQYHHQCKICNSSADKSALDSTERERLRAKAEEKAAYQHHKSGNCVRSACKFCLNPVNEAQRQSHRQHQFSGIKFDPDCYKCKIEEYEEDMSKAIRVRRDAFVKEKEKKAESKLVLSELDAEVIEDDRLFGSGRVSGAAGLLNEVVDEPSGAIADTGADVPLGLNAPASPNAATPVTSGLLGSPIENDGSPPSLKPVQSSARMSPPISTANADVRDFKNEPFWEGTFFIAEDKSFKVEMIPVQGSIKDLDMDLAHQVVAKGRLEKATAFSYLKKVHARQKLGIAIVEFLMPNEPRDKQIYLDHVDFLLSKNQLGGTAQNPAMISQMYIMALAASESFPIDFGFNVPFNSRLPTLFAIIVRNRPVTDNFKSEGSLKSFQMRGRPPSPVTKTQELYKEVILNPSKPINEIVSRADARDLPPFSRSTAKLYPESQSSSFPYFREEVDRNSSGHERFSDWTKKSEASSNWRREGGDQRNSSHSALSRFKNDPLKSETSVKRSEEYINHLYKPLDTFDGRQVNSSPPPRPPPRDVYRPPLPNEPHPGPYAGLSETDRIRLEYGSDIRPMKRAVELVDTRDQPSKRPREVIQDPARVYGSLNHPSRPGTHVGQYPRHNAYYNH